MMLGSLISPVTVPTCFFDVQGTFTLGNCKPLGLGLDAWWVILIGIPLLSIIEFIFAPLRGAGIYLFARYQRWRSVGRISPVSGTRISVLLIRLQGDDAAQSLRQSILDAIHHELGGAIEIIKWPLLVPILEGHEADAERLIFRKIQKWLRITSCDVAVWGRVKNDDTLSLRFTVPKFGSRLPENYKLTDELELPKKFTQTLGLAIAMRVCVLEWSARPEPELIDYLKASIERLKPIIQKQVFDDDVKAALIITYGRALLTIGETQHSAQYIQYAINIYKAALKAFPPSRSLPIWEALSVSLATALCSLGALYNPNSFAEAEAIYRDVLQRVDPGVELIKWGAITCDLGTTLARMGERDGPEKLEDAITLFKEAAKICTREKAPAIWAFIMCSTAVVCVSLGEHRTEPKSLVDAIVFFRAALKEWTRNRSPLLWASAQGLLANAYRILGERRKQPEELIEAIVCARNSLKEISRRNAPILWAHSQTNLGISHLALAELTKSITEAKKALRAIRRASTELTRARSLPDWVMAQINLGHALLFIGTLSKRPRYLWAATDVCDFGLRFADPGTMPFRAAMLANNLGAAQMQLGTLLGRTESFEQAFYIHSIALKLYRANGDVYYVERTKQHVAALMLNIGMAATSKHSFRRWFELMNVVGELWHAPNAHRVNLLTKKLGKIANDRTMSGDTSFLAYCRFHIGYQHRLRAELALSRTELEEAKKNLSEAARLWGQERAQLAWARAEFELGNIYLGEAQNGSTDAVREALIKFKGAIARRARSKVPRDWASAKVNLAAVYGARSDRGSSSRAVYNSWRMIRNCDEALKVLTMHDAPSPWALAHNNRATAFLKLGQLLQSSNAFFRIPIRFLFGVPDESAARSLLETLSVYTFERQPLYWAMAKFNLSVAFVLRGIRQKRNGALLAAMASVDEAIRVFTYRNAPVRWAMCQTLRADALTAMGKNDRNTAPLREAVAAYDQAIKVFSANGAHADLTLATKGLEEAQQVLKRLSPT